MLAQFWKWLDEAPLAVEEEANTQDNATTFAIVACDPEGL